MDLSNTCRFVLDDDLFINQAANGKNTTIAYAAESFTLSKPKHPTLIG
jgi:hypothetical protein